MPRGRKPLGEKRLLTDNNIVFKESASLPLEKLNKIAKSMGTNKSDLIRKAIFEYLENHQIQIPA